MKIMLTILALVATCGAAQAGIIWSWTNAGTGTEQGAFITEGTTSPTSPISASTGTGPAPPSSGGAPASIPTASDCS